MKVSPDEYKQLIYNAADPNNFINELLIPLDEPIYQIDLNKRTSEAPTLLGVSGEHDAEVFWFQTNRFFDNFDLSEAVILVQYCNADNEKFVHLTSPIVVASDDYRARGINTDSEKILIAWPVGKDVTKKAGTIEFSFQFFRLNKGGEEFAYIINTQPVKSKVVAGMDMDVGFDTESNPIADQLEAISDRLAQFSNDYTLYWLEVE